MASQTQNEEEDDWETAEIILPPKQVLRPTASSFLPRAAAPTPSEPPTLKKTDIWEDNEFFRGAAPTSSRQIWDSANARAPVPQIVTDHALPQPKVQLLRRSSSSTSPRFNHSTLGNNDARKNPQGKTLGEREEEYRQARERIFGSSSTETLNGFTSSTSRTSTPIENNERTFPSSSKKKVIQKRDEREFGGYRQSPSANYLNTMETPQPFDGLIPSQIRSVSRPSSQPTHPVVGAALGSGGQGKIVRQPVGPDESGGFAGVPSGGFHFNAMSVERQGHRSASSQCRLAQDQLTYDPNMPSVLPNNAHCTANKIAFVYDERKMRVDGSHKQEK
ncbi:hypothetical protein L204_101233 [Cryptococcus depauperatus]|nr:hypothetical protein L204_00837 [Cryptococcus depauperatus CBS 7855]